MSPSSVPDHVSVSQVGDLSESAWAALPLTEPRRASTHAPHNRKRHLYVNRQWFRAPLGWQPGIRPPHWIRSGRVTKATYNGLEQAGRPAQRTSEFVGANPERARRLAGWFTKRAATRLRACMEKRKPIHDLCAETNDECPTGELIWEVRSCVVSSAWLGKHASHGIRRMWR
jgi:hypothetical protein